MLPILLRRYALSNFESGSSGAARLFAIKTGYYTFSFMRDGEPKTLPARYSFTLVKGENRMIVDHHSSAMPNPPR